MERELEDFDNLDAVDDSEAYYTDEELADLNDELDTILTEEDDAYSEETDNEDEDEEEEDDDNPLAAYDPDEWN